MYHLQQEKVINDKSPLSLELEGWRVAGTMDKVIHVLNEACCYYFSYRLARSRCILIKKTQEIKYKM